MGLAGDTDRHGQPGAKSVPRCLGKDFAMPVTQGNELADRGPGKGGVGALRREQGGIVEIVTPLDKDIRPFTERVEAYEAAAGLPKGRLMNQGDPRKPEFRRCLLGRGEQVRAVRERPAAPGKLLDEMRKPHCPDPPASCAGDLLARPRTCSILEEPAGASRNMLHRKGPMVSKSR